jgi:hypothetical protein
MLAFVPALAQGQTGKIHGHIQDPVGVAVADGIVMLTTDGKTPKYTFNTDAGGNYTGDGIAPDTYSLLLRRPDTPKDKILDQIDNVKIVAGQDLLLDDDMGRPDYISKMSPEQRKQVEEVRKKNSDVMKENAQIKNLNRTCCRPAPQQEQEVCRSRNFEAGSDPGQAGRVGAVVRAGSRPVRPEEI